jgi:hypothetical protein
MCGKKYIFICNLVDRQSSGKEHGNLVTHCSQFFGFHYTTTGFLHVLSRPIHVDMAVKNTTIFM